MTRFWYGYNGKVKEFRQILKTLNREAENYDHCAHCVPDPMTGNCPCDNGYICEHM